MCNVHMNNQWNCEHWTIISIYVRRTLTFPRFIANFGVRQRMVQCKYLANSKWNKFLVVNCLNLILYRRAALYLSVAQFKSMHCSKSSDH